MKHINKVSVQSVNEEILFDSGTEESISYSGVFLFSFLFGSTVYCGECNSLMRFSLPVMSCSSNAY